MKVICAWCDKYIMTKEPIDDDSISHGMCDTCKDKILEDMNKASTSITASPTEVSELG